MFGCSCSRRSINPNDNQQTPPGAVTIVNPPFEVMFEGIETLLESLPDKQRIQVKIMLGEIRRKLEETLRSCIDPEHPEKSQEAVYALMHTFNTQVIPAVNNVLAQRYYHGDAC